MDKDLQIELLKKDVSFKDKEIDKLKAELKESKDDYSILVTGYKKLQDKVLELSNHIALYSSEETMLKEINKLTAESTEWESKYYLEQEKNSKALEYINTHDLYIEVIDYDYEENHETTMIRDDIAKEDLSKILKGVEKDER